jgi:hypothetical protein
MGTTSLLPMIRLPTTPRPRAPASVLTASTEKRAEVWQYFRERR